MTGHALHQTLATHAAAAAGARHLAVDSRRHVTTEMAAGGSGQLLNGKQMTVSDTRRRQSITALSRAATEPPRVTGLSTSTITTGTMYHTVHISTITAVR